MTPPRSVLVLITRRIGDVLLTTPLIRSLKQAWPHAAIDVLVFAGTEGVLAGNPDVRSVLSIAERPRLMRHIALLLAIVRRYDVALSAVPADRPTLYAWWAGRWRAGLIEQGIKHQWKRWLLNRWVEFDDVNTHTVLMQLALTRTLEIAPHHAVVAPGGERDISALEVKLGCDLSTPYAVLHCFPKFNYKLWHRAGWISIAGWLQQRGLRILLTASDDPTECDYVASIHHDIAGSINLSGRLTLTQAAGVLAHARVYVGPDTALTHMAAALDVPVVALYGPTNPVKWGPWPARQREVNPWRRHGSQRVGNVALVQGLNACVPCHKEGCDRHIDSFSDCLQELSVPRVVAALSQVLAAPRRLDHNV